MTTASNVHDAAARIVALMVAADGRIDDGALQALERIQAFRSLGIDRREFIGLARAQTTGICSHLGETSWLRDEDRAYVDGLLNRVVDPDERLLVAQLARAALFAGHGPCDTQRLVYAHMLAGWHIAPESTVGRTGA